MKKVISNSSMTCAVFGASVYHLLPTIGQCFCSGPLTTATTSEMRKVEILTVIRGLIKAVVNVFTLGCGYFVCYYDASLVVFVTL